MDSRCLATHCLTKVTNAMSTSAEGPPALLAIFKKMFGSFADSHIIKQNDFCNLQAYFLQKVSLRPWKIKIMTLQPPSLITYSAVCYSLILYLGSKDSA